MLPILLAPPSCRALPLNKHRCASFKAHMLRSLGRCSALADSCCVCRRTKWTDEETTAPRGGATGRGRRNMTAIPASPDGAPPTPPVDCRAPVLLPLAPLSATINTLPEGGGELLPILLAPSPCRALPLDKHRCCAVKAPMLHCVGCCSKLAHGCCVCRRTRWTYEETTAPRGVLHAGGGGT
jgi:hypothetical protein